MQSRSPFTIPAMPCELKGDNGMRSRFYEILHAPSFHSALHTFVISNKVLHALQQIVLSSYRFSMLGNTPRDDIKVVADIARESSSKGLPGDMTFEVKIVDVNDGWMKASLYAADDQYWEQFVASRLPQCKQYAEFIFQI